MPATPAPPPAAPASLNEALARVAERGLAEYVARLEWADPLVDLLHRQVGGRRVFVQVGVRLFSAVARRAAAAAGRSSARGGARLLSRAFFLVPRRGRLLEALATLEKRTLAEAGYRRVVEGMEPGLVPFPDTLPPDKRADLIVFHGLSQVLQRQRPQPALKIRLNESSGQRFVFFSRHVPLVGRDDALRRLDAFLDAPAPFAWWMVRGPGGSGKSRLALELCLRRVGQWRMGWLPDRELDGFDWHRWQPSRPTLLIVDYAEARAGLLRRAAVSLAERADGDAQGELLAHPVRLLLLVRGPSPAWRSELAGAGGWERDAMERARHGDPELDLGQAVLDDEALWTVLTSFLPPGAPRPDRAATLARLVRMDPLRRPLFAAFAGDALGSGRDPGAWDAATLVHDVLAREQGEFWRGADEAHRTLLALATLMGGMPTAVLAELQSPLLPPPGAFDPAAYAAMAGAPAAELLRPLEPDLLGELFVLEHLAPRSAVDGRAAELRRLAWRAQALPGRPDRSGFVAFLARAALDFPQHPTLERLLRPEDGAAEQRARWADAVLPLVEAYARAGRWDRARALHASLAELAGRHPDEPGLRALRARAGERLAHAACDAGQTDAALEVRRELDALAAAHPAEPELRRGWAAATVHLAGACADAGAVHDVRALHDEVAAVSRGRPDDAPLLHERARAAATLVFALENAGEGDAAERVAGELAALAEAHPGHAGLRHERARAMRYRAYRPGRAGEGEAVDRLRGELAALARAHPGEPALRHEWAKSVADLAHAYGTSGRLDAMERQHAELGALADAHPDDPALRVQRARSGRTLAVAYAQAGRADDARAAYAAVGALSAAYPDEPALREQRAAAAAELADVRTPPLELEAVRALDGELAALCAAHPGEPVLRTRRARTAERLGAALEAAGARDGQHRPHGAPSGPEAARAREDLRRLQGELSALAAAYPDEPDLRYGLLLVTGSLARLLLADAATEAEGWRLYDELSALSDAHPRERQLLRMRAAVTADLTTVFRNQGRLDSILRLLPPLTGLAREHPEERDFVPMRATALENMALLLADVPDPAAVREICAELDGLAAARAGDENLRGSQAWAAAARVRACCAAGLRDEARAAADALARLAARHPDDGSVRRAHARALGALAAGGPEARADAARCVPELFALVDAHPDDLSLCWEAATAAAFLAGSLPADAPVQEVEALHRRARALAQARPENVHLQRQAAATAQALAGARSRAGDADGVRRVLDELSAAAAPFPWDPHVVAARAWVMQSLATTLRDPEQLGELRQLYLRAAMLAPPAAHEAELRLPRAWIGSLLAFRLGMAGLHREARRVLQGLRALADAHPDDPQLIRRWAACAAGLALTVPEGALKLHRQQQLFQEVAAVAARRQDDAEIQLQRAALYGTLVRAWSEISLRIARGLYAELATLAAGFPGEPRMREEQARAAERLAVRHALRRKFHRAGQAYGELLRLVDAHPGEGALRASCARAAAAVAASCAAAGDGESIRFLLGGMGDLAARHPDDAELRRAWTQVAAHAARLEAAGGRAEEARALFDDARARAAALPDADERRAEEAAVLGFFSVAWMRAGWMDEARRAYGALASMGEAHAADGAVREAWTLAARELLPLVDDGDEDGFRQRLERHLAASGRPDA